jgi:hypothetical protein
MAAESTSGTRVRCGLCSKTCLCILEKERSGTFVILPPEGWTLDEDEQSMMLLCRMCTVKRQNG